MDEGMKVWTVNSNSTVSGNFWRYENYRSVYRTVYLYRSCLLIITVGGSSRKEKKKAKNTALVAGTQRTLSYLFL
jgi:hypothetical protein